MSEESQSKTRFLADRMRNSNPSSTVSLGDRAKALKQQKGVELIDLTIGQPHFDTPAKIKESAEKAIDSGFTFYTESSGIPELIEALQEKFEKENKISVSKSEILVTVGAKEAVFDTVFCTINQGDQVLILDPYWNTYSECVKFAGGVPVSLPLAFDEQIGFRLDQKRLRDLVTQKTKMIILNSPHNPSGMVFERGELEAIADLCRENDLIAVSDEIYEKIIFDDSRHYSIGSFEGMKDRTVTINGFSKAFAMTGWRLGYVCGPKEIISCMKTLHQHTITHPASFVQKAAVVAITECQEEVEQMRVEYQRLRDYFVGTVLRRRSDLFVCSKPEGTFYAFPKIKSRGVSTQEMADALLERAHILCVPGSSFASQGEGHLRFVFANNQSVLERVGERLEEL